MGRGIERKYLYMVSTGKLSSYFLESIEKKPCVCVLYNLKKSAIWSSFKE